MSRLPGFAPKAAVALAIAAAGGLGLASQSRAAARALTPADLHAAYRLPNDSASPPLVAVVSPYDAPRVASDLTAYSHRFGLPSCGGCFRKVDENGGGALPISDASWAAESELDVETIRGICHNCRIVLVEASSANPGDLATAMDTAVSLGAKVVSTSFLLPETVADAGFSAAFARPGIVVTAAAGDLGSGGGPQFPASIPGVVAVGGTRLTVAGGRRAGETAWSSHGQASGSGCSTIFAAPGWQASATGGLCAGRRAYADVAADADPDTGALVYVNGKLMVGGGTSLASPIIAGAFALAGGVAPGTIAAQLLYANARELHDITSGATGSCASRLCRAGPGWDGPTGLGTPDGLAAFEPTPKLNARQPNVSVTAVSRAGGPNHLLVRLRNRNGFPVSGVLTLSSGGVRLAAARWQLARGGSATVAVSLTGSATARPKPGQSVLVVLQLVDGVGHRAQVRRTLRVAGS